MVVESKYKFKGYSHHAVDTLTRRSSISTKYLRPQMHDARIYVETAEITFERTYFTKGNATIGTYVQEWEFVRNEIFANSARPMGFSCPSTSSYSADDGKLYNAISQWSQYNFKIWFSEFSM